MTEPDFSKMSTREIMMWEFKNAKPKISKIDTVEIEKEVWESTLNRSMVLQAENDKLKTDCHTLAQKLLQVKPELRDWLEINYGEYYTQVETWGFDNFRPAKKSELKFWGE